jgi:hypothetical protein
MTVDKASTKSVRLTAMDGDQIRVFLLMVSTCFVKLKCRKSEMELYRPSRVVDPFHFRRNVFQKGRSVSLCCFIIGGLEIVNLDCDPDWLDHKSRPRVITVKL